MSLCWDNDLSPKTGGNYGTGGGDKVRDFTTVKTRYNDSLCSQSGAIKMNLQLYRILNEQIDI